jgi:hypothetical protein
MRRIIATFVLTLSLLGCAASRGAQVPLVTDETVTTYAQGCILMHEVVDVTADPTTGTPVLTGGDHEVRWPKGFTAWRVGSGVEVLDASGGLILTTGARYSICPAEYLSGWWVPGGVTPCPDCPLGYKLD